MISPSKSSRIRPSRTNRNLFSRAWKWNSASMISSRMTASIPRSTRPSPSPPSPPLRLFHHRLRRIVGVSECCAMVLSHRCSRIWPNRGKLNRHSCSQTVANGKEISGYRQTLMDSRRAGLLYNINGIGRWRTSAEEPKNELKIPVSWCSAVRVLASRQAESNSVPRHEGTRWSEGCRVFRLRGARTQGRTKTNKD